MDQARPVVARAGRAQGWQAARPKPQENGTRHYSATASANCLSTQYALIGDAMKILISRAWQTTAAMRYQLVGNSRVGDVAAHSAWPPQRA